MEEIETFFFTENADIDSSISKDKLKIGEIFRHKDGTTSLNCIRCSQEFDFFTEFTLHIQEHYLRNEILPQVDNIKTEDEADFIDGDSMPITRVSEKLIDVQPDGSYSDNDNGDTSFNSYLNEVREAISLSKGDLIYDEQSTDDDEDIKSMQDDNESNMFFEEVEKTQLGNSAKIEKELILNKHYKEVDGKFQCLLCLKSVTKYRILKDHYLAHIGTKNVYCPLCSKGFITVGYVQKHCYYAHKQSVSRKMIRNGQSKNDPNMIVTPQKFQPQKVQPQKKIQLILNKHFKRVGSKYKCLQCSKLLTNFSIMKDHYSAHIGTKRVICPQCSKAFITVGYVQKHCYYAHKQSVSRETIRKAQANTEDFQTTYDMNNENRDEAGVQNASIQLNDLPILKKHKSITTRSQSVKNL